MTAITHRLTAANMDSLSEAVKNLHSPPIQLRCLRNSLTLFFAESFHARREAKYSKGQT